MSTVYLICDISGSMVESGKRFILRNLVRTVDQYYRLQKSQVEIKLIPWGKEAVIAKWVPGQEVPAALVNCEGNASGDALVEKVRGLEDGYFAILTDGYWSPDTRKQIGNWSKSLAPNRLRIIKIGEDADPRLKGPSVFDAEDLLPALKGWVG